jgi:hypothetical protein
MRRPRHSAPIRVEVRAAQATSPPAS